MKYETFYRFDFGIWFWWKHNMEIIVAFINDIKWIHWLDTWHEVWFSFKILEINPNEINGQFEEREKNNWESIAYHVASLYTIFLREHYADDGMIMCLPILT